MKNISNTSLFQLKVGFSVMLFFALAIGVSALYQIWHLSGLTEKLYLHPFAVSTALRDLRSELYDIESILSDLETTNLMSNVEKKQAAIEEKNKGIQELFDFVTIRYLGDKKDLNFAKDSFKQWRSLIYQTLDAYMHNFDRGMKAKLISEVNAQGKQFLSALEVMIDFAGNKAKIFNENAHNSKKSSIYFTFALVFCSTLIIIGVGKFVLNGVMERIRSDNSYHKQFHDNSAVMLLIDPDTGQIIDANASAVQFYGYKREHLLSMRITEINDLPEHDVKNRMNSVTLNYGRLFIFRHRLADGTLRYVEVSSSRIRFGGREILYSIIYDITERIRVEEELRKSEERYRMVVDTANEGICSIDSNHVITYINNAMSRMFGYEKNEIIGRKIEEFIFPEDLLNHSERMKKRYEGKDESYDRKFIRKDGATLWARVSATSIKDEQGNFIGSFAMIADITERKQNEIKLNSLKWLQEKKPIFNAGLPAPSYGNLVELNKSRLIADSLGYDTLYSIVNDFLVLLQTSATVYEKNGDHALGIFSSGWCRHMDEASRKLCRCADNSEALASGKWLCHESCWTEASSIAIRTGKAVDIVCNGGIHLYAEPIFAGEEIIGTINFGYGTPPQDKTSLSELAHLYETDLDILVNLSKEYEVRPKFIIDVAKQRLATSAKLIGEMVERSRTEKKLYQAKKSAEAASMAKTEFLANMSHEIRTPINGIMGMLQLLQMTTLNKTQQEYAAVGIESSKRLTRLLSDILDLSSVESGKIQIVSEPFNLEKAIHEIVQLFLSNANQAKVELRVEIESAVPTSVIGDKIRLQQIFTNLIGNALKFTKSGSVTIEACLVGTSRSGHVQILFSVVDTGTGLSKEVADVLFEPFTQGPKDFRRGQHGAGLGLAICKRLTHMMGGDISVESELGQGASFYFSIPFMFVEKQDQSFKVLSDSEKITCPAIRILLAEDDEINSFAIGKLLENLGCVVRSVANGEEVLEALREDYFDLVLMDIQMPVMDGVEATQAIRLGEAGEDRKGIPTIAMTAYAMNGDRKKFMEAGMDDYIAKPIEMNVLKKMLARFLSTQ